MTRLACLTLVVFAFACRPPPPEPTPPEPATPEPEPDSPEPLGPPNSFPSPLGDPAPATPE